LLLFFYPGKKKKSVKIMLMQRWLLKPVRTNTETGGKKKQRMIKTISVRVTLIFEGFYDDSFKKGWLCVGRK